jgi:DNA repair photolyase
MIISASRRTDIPAFYSEWFMNRIREGYCTVPNPFNNKQISVIDLSPKSIEAIVFWTRNPKPLLEHLKQLDELGYNYYFQFTINNYPRKYEKYNPSLISAISIFKELSNRIGSGKVIWRYDPILLTDDLTVDFHLNNFENIAGKLKGFTKRVVISIVDDYKKTVRRLTKLDVNYKEKQEERPEMERMLKTIVEFAHSNNMEVQSCAEAKNYGYLGIKPGKCIDDDILLREFGIDSTYKKDKSQRLACGCMVSRDIGINNTCFMGCEYCYAVTSHERAVNNKKKHDPKFSSLIKHKITEDVLEKIKILKNSNEIELNLFSQR